MAKIITKTSWDSPILACWWQQDSEYTYWCYLRRDHHDPSPRRSESIGWWWAQAAALGKVERLDGFLRIKVARMGAAGGQEPLIPLDWVASGVG